MQRANQRVPPVTVHFGGKPSPDACGETDQRIETDCTPLRQLSIGFDGGRSGW